MRMMSGSCRSTRRSAEANDAVSSPTSRWLMLQLMSRCRNSMGSSMLMTFARRVSLTYWIIDARAVDFPEPVMPVTSTRPRGLRAISSSTGGRLRSRMESAWKAMARKTKAMVPRCWYMFTRSGRSPARQWRSRPPSRCRTRASAWRADLFADGLEVSGFSGAGRATTARR